MTEPDPTPTEDFVIRLDHFLKMHFVTATGGQAKLLIQDGQVQVNGDVETRRRRKLRQGDVVAIEGAQFTV